MPGAGAAPLDTPEDDEGNSSTEEAENIPLFLPSSLDAERRERVCLPQVAEYERLLRMAQLQDSLIELRHTHKIRRKLLVNHITQVAGQGQRANTCSRAVLNSVESRIAKFVDRYRVTYRALLQLDPIGSWRDTYLELKDSDNRGPGKEKAEEGVGDGTYFRSWIWLPNPHGPDTADGDTGEEGASEEDVNEVLRVEWTTSFARLERWKEEVELLQEEMRRAVMFLEWKSQGWSAKAKAPRRDTTPDIESGLVAYARKQEAIHHDLAISFTKLWHPALVANNLEHSWAMEVLVGNGVPLAEIDDLAVSTQASRAAPPSTIAPPSTTTLTTDDPPILEEYDDSEDLDDSDMEGSGLYFNYDSDFDYDSEC